MAALYLDALLLAKYGIVQPRKPKLEPGIICIPNPLQSIEELREIREFACMTMELNSIGDGEETDK